MKKKIFLSAIICFLGSGAILLTSGFVSRSNGANLKHVNSKRVITEYIGFYDASGDFIEVYGVGGTVSHFGYLKTPTGTVVTSGIASGTFNVTLNTVNTTYTPSGYSQNHYSGSASVMSTDPIPY